MSRLPRPPIPIEVRCRVVLRQLGESWPDDVIRANRFVPRVVPSRSLGKLLAKLLTRLAEQIGCEVSDLRLDHDPALENREKLVEMPNGRRHKTVVVPKGAKVIQYYPDANDPEHLRYRPHAPEFAGSHLIKTNVRGDRGQHSDRALAAKNKRIARNCDPKRKKAKIRSATRWPPRGSRKVQNRRTR